MSATFAGGTSREPLLSRSGDTLSIVATKGNTSSIPRPSARVAVVAQPSGNWCRCSSLGCLGPRRCQMATTARSRLRPVLPTWPRSRPGVAKYGCSATSCGRTASRASGSRRSDAGRERRWIPEESPHCGSQTGPSARSLDLIETVLVPMQECARECDLVRSAECTHAGARPGRRGRLAVGCVGTGRRPGGGARGARPQLPDRDRIGPLPAQGAQPRRGRVGPRPAGLRVATHPGRRPGTSGARRRAHGRRPTVDRARRH